MIERPSVPPDSWNIAHKAARKLVAPIQRFLAIEAASGLLLLITVVAALVWANSPARDAYDAIWHVPIGFRAGSIVFEHDLHYWVNEGLMTIFFFVVGLEIRREIHEGELSSLRRAALPVIAALGGVIVPALIFVAFNAGRAGSHGWAIPMATDIAFAVGVLTLLGSRVPHAWRVLLLGLAVIDDIAAIIVIAVFFSAGFEVTGIVIVATGVAVVMAMRAIGVRSPVAYIVPGAAVWLGLERAGIHPTLAGVILGLLTPVMPWFGPSGFAETTAAHLESIGNAQSHELLTRLDEINRARREAVSPAERLIHALHPWVAFGIMPLFALANSGVPLGGASLGGDSWFLFLGIVVGLAAGKPLGITIASLGAARLGIVERSSELTNRGVLLVGTVGGIGFTMSLFIAQLALPDPVMLSTAKLAVLVGSGIAIVVGLLFGRFSLGASAAAPVPHTAGSPPPS